MKKLIASILSILIFTLTYNSINMQYAYGSSESKYIYVYAHENSNFAIREDGTIWQWGQMNNGTIRVTPTLIATLPNAIKCTSTHVLRSDGFVWSYNSENSSLTQIDALSDVVDIQEEYYTKSDGTVWSLANFTRLDGIKSIKKNFTLEENGTLLNLDNIIDFEPVDTPSDWQAHYIVALKSDGTVCTLNEDYKISIVKNLTDVVQLAIGGTGKIGTSRPVGWMHYFDFFGLCLRRDGTVWSFEGSDYDIKSAEQIKELTDIKSVAAGKEHSIALTNSGEIFTWGNNSYGQLGIGCSAIRKSPQRIAVVPGAVSISSGYGYITLCKNDGTVCELPLGATGKRNSLIQPIKVTNLKNARYIDGRSAIDRNGYVWTWAYNEKNAKKIPDLSGITAIKKSFALKNDGTIWSFSSYRSKELKNVIAFDLDPVRINGSPFGEYSNLIVLKKDGTAWKIPTFLLDGLAEGTDLKLEEASKIISIIAGAKNIVAPNYVLKSDGTVSCGREIISDLKDIRSISTYSDSKLFTLKNDGTIWLSDDYYKVDGITNSIGITVGGRDLWDTDFMNGEILHQFFAVVEKDGSVFVWGNNEDGLFNNFGTNMNTPVKVCSSDAVLQIDSTSMSFKGEECEVDPGRTTTPVIENGRTLVPLRNIIEKFGGTVKWDGITKTVTIISDSNTIELQIDSTIARINSEERVMDVAPCLINSRTMLPLRFISENLGISVEWNNEYRTIYLNK